MIALHGGVFRNGQREPALGLAHPGKSLPPLVLEVQYISTHGLTDRHRYQQFYPGVAIPGTRLMLGERAGLSKAGRSNPGDLDIVPTVAAPPALCLLFKFGKWPRLGLKVPVCLYRFSLLCH